MPVYRKPRYKHRTVTRPKTRWKCRWVEKRTVPRVFDAKSAARAVCAAIQHGVSKSEVDREVQKRCKVGQPMCECESVALSLRQVLTMVAAVALLLAVSRFAVAVIPALVTISVRFLPRAIAARLTGIRETIRQLPDASRTIEGVFTRVRENLAQVERVMAP